MKSAHPGETAGRSPFERPTGQRSGSSEQHMPGALRGPMGHRMAWTLEGALPVAATRYTSQIDA
jgi:hypothetical protein